MITPQREQQLKELWRQLVAGSSGTKESELGQEQLEHLDEALTHTSTGLARHHEQLEFLGDAVLRLAASDFIESEHPQMPVGERSALRAQLVSDRWLANLGGRIGIESLLNLGAKASGDLAARATLRAEHCEALIGAIYRISGMVSPVQTWLTPYWRETSHEVLADPHRGNSKSALQEWTQAQGLGLPTYTCQEISRRHGDPRRFHCQVFIQDQNSPTAEAWGGSRRQAEQQAAKAAMQQTTLASVLSSSQTQSS
ncbi:ribonuclease III [Synechococcus sp. MVIR-18-1]|uniref:ribonuclease III n=1 Tax=Synechococcus sp. MVIR-18-1 TaxID=1386941 RepID=UPI0016441BC1|nr:ribonuclease III [Synechococcus sp. MVIR-18-1]QNI75259.1 ribonuclease III [Synechococcus sp. MVIR-18-1]